MTSSGGRQQSILVRQIADTIKDTHMTLDDLSAATGINRAKLGRMRLSKAPVNFDDAEAIFLATRRPSRAMVILACLGEERILTPEVLAYLDNFLSTLPDLLDKLNELGSTLNPKWARGSAHHIGVLMAEHAERRIQAEAFAPRHVGNG